MRQQKKDYLNKYILQEQVINRLKKMCLKNPQNISKYKEEIINAETLRDEIEEKIIGMENPVFCELLSEKYIFGRTLEEIALILNYSKRHI